MLKCLPTGDDCAFGLCQQKRKVQLTVKKVNSGENAETKVRMIFFDLKIQEDRVG